jgi:hypothetical protein
MREPVKALRKLARQSGQPVLASVQRQRQPHHQQDRPPFLQKRGDEGKARSIGSGIDGLERVRDAELQFPDGYTDATFAEVEGKYGTKMRVLSAVSCVRKRRPLALHRPHWGAPAEFALRMPGIL